MNILTISLDRKLFEPSSDVAKRMVACGKIASSWHIVVFNVAESKKKLIDSQLSDNVFVYPINSFSRFTYLFSAWRKIKDILKKEKINIIVTQDSFELGWLGRRVAKKMRLPLQVQVHTDVLSHYYRNESMHNRFRFYLSKIILNKADGIRVVSRRIEHSLQKIWKISADKLFLLPVLINSDKLINIAKPAGWLKNEYSKFDHIFLVASRFSREKNIGLAIEALANIVKENRKVGLIIIGSGKCDQDLKKIVKKLKLSDSVIFLPWQDNIGDFYRGADALLLPSNYEGYGMTIVEAMMAGALVIATDVGVAGELLEDIKNGIVVPVGRSDKLFEAMSRVINDAGLAQKLRDCAVEIKSAVLNEGEFLISYKNILENTIKNYEHSK